MPHLNALIKYGTLQFPDQQELSRHCRKWDGQWVKVTIEPVVCGMKKAKSPNELGYYWGFLLPEIHKEMEAQGNTKTMVFCGEKTYMPITVLDVHEMLTGQCMRVGENGAGIRLSDADFHQASKIIKNVLLVAEQLGMNVEAMEAWHGEESKV